MSAGITEEAMQVVAQGEFSNIRNNPILQNMYFSPVEARYFKLKATRMVDESDSLGVDSLSLEYFLILSAISATCLFIR